MPVRGIGPLVAHPEAGALVRWLLVAAFLVGGGGALSTGLQETRVPSVTSLDVGQGDATLIDAGVGVLIDTGIPGSRAVEKAAALGLPVQALIVTHLERDHGGDAAAVIRNARPAAVLWNGRTDVPLYETIRASAESQGIPLVSVMPGDVLRAGEATYRILWPDLAYRTSDDHNDSSLVVRADLPAFSALVTGDLPIEAEAHLLGQEIDADVLKVGHHGSKGSSGEAFLAAVSPGMALISVGASNTYGHPTTDALQRLADAGAEVHRTDQEGSIRITSEQGILSATAHAP